MIGRWAPCLLLAIPLVVGCEHKRVVAKTPPPPELPAKTESVPVPSTGSPKPPNASVPSQPSVSVERAPIYTQLGMASWYGPPYHNRKGANGEIYDMNAMTAAHRTLPLNSIVRVTNVKTSHSAIVRITDRGPFIGERMLDLSLAAAKAIDVWGPGVAWVRMDVLQTPAPIDSGGKWAVQIGAFSTADAALEMKQRLTRRFNSTHILEFAGPTGDWVRIRVQNDDRELAEKISRSVSTPEGGVFLVRLD